jgi:CRISPR-associated exonuclease Cas4
MWPDDDRVMISAIEHYSYCPRRCGLIHLESIYEENVFTLKGKHAHERVDTLTWETAGTTRVERALPLWSEQWGLIGRADVVEFRADGSLCPVEYKHGPRRRKRHDDLQLCAQAACLEEMFGQSVPVGAIYYVTTRRRREVVFTAALRSEMEEIVRAIRQMQQEGRTPPPVNDARCPNCSLVDACVPAVIEAARLEWHLRELFRVDND